MHWLVFVIVWYCCMLCEAVQVHFWSLSSDCADDILLRTHSKICLLKARKVSLALLCIGSEKRLLSEELNTYSGIQRVTWTQT